MQIRKHKNFTMIKNKMWEAFYLKPLPCNEFKVWAYIYRYTVMWGLEFREVTTDEISKKLEMRSSTVRKCKRALIKKCRIVKKGLTLGIQTDWNLWLVGQEIPTKVVGQEVYTDRSTDVHLVGQEIPLIKETLKERNKRKGLSPSQKEKKRKEYKTGLAMLKEAVKRIPDRKRKN